MNWLSRGALVAALLAVGCGGGGGGSGTNKPAGVGGSTGAGGAPPPGQEAGTPGTRGGGGGAFGGGSDPDAGGGSPEEDAAPVNGDGSTVSADARLSNDRPRDTSFTPVDAVTPADSASPAPDAGNANGCDTNGICAMYEADFRNALTRARACNPMLKLQCQMTSATSLSCSGCKVWVNSSVELDAIRTQWNDAGCQKCQRVCPAIACRAVTTGVCHSKMLAAPPEPETEPVMEQIVVPPMYTGTCIDQSDPVPF